MKNLETLKQEIIKQKTAVEGKGGTVWVKGTNPSPSEITDGINSIPVFDGTDATATEEDVLEGKTFYAGDWNIRTGTYQKPQTLDLGVVLFYKESYSSTSERTEIHFPASYLKARNYLFYSNVNPIDIYFNPQLTAIGTYCFAYNVRFRFFDLENCSVLKSIGSSAFYNCDLDPALYPPNLKTVGQYTFYNTLYNYSSLVLPQGLETLDKYSFASPTDRIPTITNLDISGFVGEKIPSYVFINGIYNDSISIPNTVETLDTYAFYNTTVDEIYVPSSVTKVNGYCFYNTTSSPAGTRDSKAVVFESTTPPTFGTSCFPTDLTRVPIKIYVPDESVSAYQAVSNLSKYKTIILPISEKA